MLVLLLTMLASAEVVVADVLKVRVSRGVHADVVARLAYGTEVAVEEVRGEWSRVQVPFRPEQHEATGWVKTSYLATEVPDPAEVALQATDADSALRWAQRWVAVAPYDRQALSFLAAAAKRGGNQALADQVGDWLSAGRPVYIAECAGGRATLLARADADGLHALGRPDAALAEAESIAGLPWYGYVVSGPMTEALDVVPPFPMPFLTVSNNESTRSAYVAGQSEIGSNEKDKVILGACRVSGVMATAPFLRQDAQPVGVGEFMGVAQLAFETHTESAPRGVEVARIGELPLREVRVSAPFTWHSCGGDSKQGLADYVLMVDDLGRIVAGQHERREGFGTWLDRIDGRSQWLQLQEDQVVAPGVIGLYGRDMGTSSSRTVLRRGQTGWQSLHVHVASWGC
ncbi:MAG: SH3 domain-containing protein [Proteobacteria bacterium]|nr:SH3 domain-containing protein [Pseudomonadota bacterium]